MNYARFHLNIAPEEYLAYYSGQARSVSVVAEDGRRIEFPAEHLRAFVHENGIKGKFEICFDQLNRFVSLNKVV